MPKRHWPIVAFCEHVQDLHTHQGRCPFGTNRRLCDLEAPLFMVEKLDGQTDGVGIPHAHDNASLSGT